MTRRERRNFWWSLAAGTGLVWGSLVWWGLSSQAMAVALRWMAAGLTAAWVTGFVAITASWFINSEEVHNG